MNHSPEDPALRELIQAHAQRHAPAQDLAARIRHGLRTAPVRAQPAPVSKWRRWWQAFALYGAGAATAWAVASAVLVVPHDTTGEQVLDGHLRSLMAEHLTDVASTEHHTVKPWFAGKLDFSPPVIDLAAQGFPLSGGRLDYIDGRPVAALVYKPGLHVVNLFVWPAPSNADVLPAQSLRKGYNIVEWTQSGMQAWAVSDMDAGELRAFAGLVRKGMQPSPP